MKMKMNIRVSLTARRVESSGAAGPLLVSPRPILDWSIALCLYVTNIDEMT